MRKRNLLVFVLLSLVGVVLLAPPPARAAVSVGGYVLTLIKWEDKICCHELPRLFATSVPIKPSNGGPPELDHNQFSLDVRQSRIWITSTDEVAGVKLSSRISADFNSTDGNALTSNSRHLRVRQAFGRADHPSGFFLLAGQHRSIVAPEDVAFLGKYAIDEFNSAPASNSGWRQPQVRVGWKTPLAPGMGSLMLEASVEKDAAPNLGSTLVDESQGEGQTAPMFGGRVTWDSPIVRLQGAAIFGRNTETFTGGSQKSKDTWLYEAQTEIKPPIGGLTLYGHFYTESGLGRSIGGAGDFPSMGVTAAGDLVNIKAWGYYAGASFVPPGMPDTQLNAYYGWEKADEEPSIGFTGNTCSGVSGNPGNNGACLKQHEGIHLNVKQRFWKSWLAGVEYKRYNVKTFGGAKGDVNFLEGALFFFF